MKKKNDYYCSLFDGEYIEHFGIKGMKWGVRRYQNSDGSYTAAGRARYKAAGGKGSKYDKVAIKDYDKRLHDYFTKPHKGRPESHAIAVGKTIDKEMQSTAEGKRLAVLNGYMKQFSEEAKKHGQSSFMLDPESDALYRKTVNDYQKRARQFVKQHEDDYASATLKDLNLEDSKLGRSYIKRSKTFQIALSVPYSTIRS